MTSSRAGRPVFSIRWIVAGAAAVLTTLVVLGVSSVLERRTRNVLALEIEGRLLLQVRNLALASSGALLTDYPELTLAPLLREMQSRQPELAWVVVVDRAGVIQGHPDVRMLGSTFRPLPSLEPIATEAPQGPHETLATNAQTLVASAPILHPSGDVLGTAWVGLNRAYIEQAVNRIRRQQYMILGAFLLAGVVLSFALMSILLRPVGTLRAGIERIGRGDLTTPLELGDRTEFGLLAQAVNGMASALRKAQEEMVEQERLAKEMELAHQIQRSLLPSGPRAAGDFVIDGEQWAAAEVGGDYYDVLELPGGKLALAIADVSGKGLAGCLVTSMISSLVRALRTLHASPASLLATLDERLSEVLPVGNFVTMFYGILDPGTGRLVYSSAGHNPLIVYRGKVRRVEWLRSNGIPLGAIRGGAIRSTLEDSTLDLDRGDLVVQFTDGISETTDPAGREQFGLERMEQVVLDAAPRGAREVLDRLHAAAAAWRGDALPEDDETVLVLNRGHASVPPGAPASPGRGASDRSGAAERFAAARAGGISLRMPATLDSLSGIDAWLARIGLLRELSETTAGLLRLALYEACANVVEHGYGKNAARNLEIWWSADARTGEPTGSFFIRDQGRPFHPDPWTAANLDDAAVRKRGRGLGLDILHRVMREVAYHPGTEAGNLLLLRWDPRTIEAGESLSRHA